MIQLKTLNAIQESSPYYNTENYLVNDLRAEAIKWIKEISKDGFDTKINIFDITIEVDKNIPKDTFQLVAQDVTRKMLKAETDLVVQWIKHFFNITDEELK